jgi:hypothetical protein
MATVPLFQNRVLRGYTKWAEAQTNHITTIQRWWRHFKQLKPSNTVDCITLEPVEKPVFLHVSDTGYVTAFSAMALAQYMVTSGNFTHPQFRTPFHSVELLRLDRCTGHRFDLLKNRHTIQTQQQEERAESTLDDFLVNEFKTHVEVCIEMCAQDNTELGWALQMRHEIENLLLEYLSLLTHNTPLAHQVIQQTIELIERRCNTLSTLEGGNPNPGFFERLFKFQLLLYTFRSNITVNATLI